MHFYSLMQYNGRALTDDCYIACKALDTDFAIIHATACRQSFLQSELHASLHWEACCLASMLGEYIAKLTVIHMS
jgi:hypothetical protein